MTHRNRPALPFGRNVAQKEPDYLKIVNEMEQNINSFSFLLLREWIELESELGEGCFGKVYRGRLRRPDSSLPTDPSYINVDLSSQAVAIKILKSPPPGIASATAQRDLLREAETMASFSHENILTLHGIVINGKLIKFIKMFA
jgi:serine/threonine protein kinase